MTPRDNYFSSNQWDAPAKTEYRLEELREYARERRSYTKHNSAYWHEGGIEAHRSETREAHLHQMNIAKTSLKHDYSTAGGQLHV